MRVVSLLPSANEALFALGLGDQVVAVTHECDFPPEAKNLPVVTRSTLDLADESSSGIEARVAAAAEQGRLMYEVDTAAIRALKPDLVVAQDVCQVCAVTAAQVADELAPIPVLRQHPHRLDDVLSDIAELARACGADEGSLIAELRGRIALATARAGTLPRIRGVFLEWLDPPYPAGHWTPDLLDLAGIDDPLARPGRPSSAITWDDVHAARPEVLFVAPCGWGLERSQDEVRAAMAHIGPAIPVTTFDGSAYFNRPGPRLVDSLEHLVSARLQAQTTTRR